MTSAPIIPLSQSFRAGNLAGSLYVVPAFCCPHQSSSVSACRTAKLKLKHLYQYVEGVRSNSSAVDADGSKKSVSELGITTHFPSQQCNQIEQNPQILYYLTRKLHRMPCIISLFCNFIATIVTELQPRVAA